MFQQEIRMKKAMAIFAIIAFCTQGQAAMAQTWKTDYKAALAESKKTGKPILVNFTGSDWCGYCIKLKKDVFTTAAFKTWAKSKVILLEIDFPRRKKLSSSVKKQNAKLKSKFSIRGYPTILFLDSSEKVLGKSGYRPGGAAPWIKNADGILTKIKKKKTP
jgi:protein disulfide-isomerase